MEPTPTKTIVSIANTDPRFTQAREIRTEVFIVEQNGPPEEEWDDKDAAATHMLATLNGEPAAVLRYYDDEGWLHIGRIAVRKQYRGLGLARDLLSRCLADAKAQGFTRSFLNAQWDKTELYRRFGYQEVGEEFMEAGIRHFRMESTL